ncbi:MAG: site-specific DNA-methyltransferase [Firmicutes bacterium]|nr:site-specific DNA-methyltransferase [Bacillota bacterium]
MELNNIYQGCAYELIKQIPTASIDLIYTDPPYLYNICKEKATKNKLHERANKRKEQLSNISNGFDYNIFAEFIRVLKHINIFIWCSEKQVKDILNWFYDRYSTKEIYHKILCWVKLNPVPLTNFVWLSDIELCIHFRAYGLPLNNSPFDTKRKGYVSNLNVSDKQKFHHPTIKPLALIQNHILHTTKPNDIVLDTFAGSGTTLVAAKNTNRNYIGYELDPKWYNIAKNRLQGITASGQTSFVLS